jgi:hypothetical protein
MDPRSRVLLGSSGAAPCCSDWVLNPNGRLSLPSRVSTRRTSCWTRHGSRHDGKSAPYIEEELRAAAAGSRGERRGRRKLDAAGRGAFGGVLGAGTERVTAALCAKVTSSCRPARWAAYSRANETPRWTLCGRAVSSLAADAKAYQRTSAAAGDGRGPAACPQRFGVIPLTRVRATPSWCSKVQCRLQWRRWQGRRELGWPIAARQPRASAGG